MASSNDQLEELKTLLSSNTKSDKPYIYSTLSNLQEQSISNPSLLQSLADSAHTLLSSLRIDVLIDDEEIAAQALKCLGFMIYHPSIVASISGDDGNIIVDSLQRVIMVTRIKSVCNLGVWCISVQQLSASLLDAHFHSLIRAIVHALDNPIGSLSITFEAMQAVMKLATQLNRQMRDSSNLWAPPIYRRLVSTDKREKDMAERCLQKIKPIICPPPIALSKAVVVDIKRKLLPAMKGLLEQGMNIQAIHAWRWFICLIEPYALKYRQLINELLKVPEQTFIDSDPQVQIATQVAWEALIDALINTPTKETETTTEPCLQQVGITKGTDGDLEAGITKRIKLIMTPLIGIMSSKCDLSVHLSCLNTWNYMLHKLDTSISSPSVIKTVLEPILEVVFRVGPHSKNILLWNFCLDLINDFALTNCENCSGLDNSSGQLSPNEVPGSASCSWKHYPVKWMPWELGQLDFFIKIIDILTRNGFVKSVVPETKSLASNSALRLFQSALKGVQNKLKISSIPFVEVMSCLNNIIMFVNKIPEDADPAGSSDNDMSLVSLQFIELVVKELEPATLGSPLYKLILDAGHIDHVGEDNEFRHEKMNAISFKDNTNKVSPIVYLTVLYFQRVFNLTSNAAFKESILVGMLRYVKLLFVWYDAPQILYTLTGLLYKYLAFDCINIWITIAIGLKDHLDSKKDLSSWKTEFDNTGNLALHHFLSYPFSVFSYPHRRLALSPREFEFGQFVDIWNSLFGCVNHVLGFEFLLSHSSGNNLFSLFNRCLEDYSTLDQTEKTQNSEFLSLCGNAATCMLQQILTSASCCHRSKNKDTSGNIRLSSIDDSLDFVVRYLRLSCAEAATSPQDLLAVTSRVFGTLAHIVDNIHSDEVIIPFVEVISSPLLQWLSHREVQDESNSSQLQKLWTSILKSLQTSWPPVTFSSTLLELQAPLLRITLDHPDPSISNPTIKFWNSTYGEQIKLDYPESLLPVLDKLSRDGKLRLCKRSHFKVTTLNRCSKRVELEENKVNARESKRKRLKLTEHQKDVRRAQQGKSTDCGGHGPGIRTYTNADFSQGNEESQEDSQELRNAESILEMLNRDGKLF